MGIIKKKSPTQTIIWAQETRQCSLPHHYAVMSRNVLCNLFFHVVKAGSSAPSSLLTCFLPTNPGSCQMVCGLTMKNGSRCSNLCSVCFQALRQLSRRTLTSSARRQVENKVPQKQKLFQVSGSDFSLLIEDEVYIWVLYFTRVSPCCLFLFFVFLHVVQLSFISEGQNTPQNSIGLKSTLTTPCSLTPLPPFSLIYLNTHTAVTWCSY